MTKLLEKLKEDSGGSENAKVLIWNLFTSNYKFSFQDFDDLFEHLYDEHIKQKLPEDKRVEFTK